MSEVDHETNFNPRSPYGERQKNLSYRAYGDNFNPRSPYGERPALRSFYSFWGYFNPRSPYGERHPFSLPSTGASDFNPRSPYGERPPDAAGATHRLRFQSTLPLRGATRIYTDTSTQQIISIHAPLTGSDCNQGPSTQAKINFNPRSPYGERRCIPQEKAIGYYFNPRSPYGERLYMFSQSFDVDKFQSTLPLRGATMYLRYVGALHFISIHAPLTGSDRVYFDVHQTFSDFNPRSPYGERLKPLGDSPSRIDISIHAPLTGSDRHSIGQIADQKHFNPRSPYGERPGTRNTG